MFYVAAALLHRAARLGRARRAAAARLLAAVAAAAAAVLVLAVPFDRFITTSAVTDTLMLLPLWSVQDRIGADWIRLAALGLAVALALLFLLVPRRYALALPLRRARAVAARDPADLVGRARVRAGLGAARSSRGSAASIADWIDAALPAGARGGVRVDGADRPADREPERVLQPPRRLGLLHRRPDPGGLRRRGSAIDPGRGLVTLPDGSPSSDEFLITDSSFEPDGEALARDEAGGSRCGGSAAPLVSRDRGRRALPERHLVGADGDLHAAPLRGGTARGRRSASDPSLFDRAADGRRPSNGAVVGGPARSECRHELSVPVVPVPRTTRLPRRSSRCRRPPSRPRSSRGSERTTACSARTSTASSTGRGREDRVRRLAALAPAARDRQLHPGLARRPRRGCRGRARDRRVRADEHPWPGADSRGARRDRRRAAHVAAALLARGAHGAGAGRASGGRASRRCASTSSTSPTGCIPPQRGGVRATTIHDLVPLHHPEWSTPRTRSMHGRKYENAARTCDVVFVNSAYTGRDVDRDARRRRTSGSASPIPAPAKVFAPDGAAAALGGAVRAHRRHSRAAEEPPDARRGAPAARRRGAARDRRRRRAGVSSRCSTSRGSAGSGTSPTTSSRASTAVRPSSCIRRASRASGSRSSRRWRAACPSSCRRTRRSTRRAAMPPSAPIPRSRGARRRDRARRSADRDGSSPPASSMRPASRGATGRVFLRGYEEARGDEEARGGRRRRTCARPSSSSCCARPSAAATGTSSRVASSRARTPDAAAARAARGDGTRRPGRRSIGARARLRAPGADAQARAARVCSLLVAPRRLGAGAGRRARRVPLVLVERGGGAPRTTRSRATRCARGRDAARQTR